jgi:hypothetical protein
VADAKRGRRTHFTARPQGVAAAAKRLARGAPRNRYRWQRIINKNPLTIEACEHQFQSAQKPPLQHEDLLSEPQRGGHAFEQDLVECLMLLAVRDPSAFGKFLALILPKQSNLAARPDAVHAGAVGPRADARGHGQVSRGIL